MRCGFALSSREAHRSLSDGVENLQGLCRQQQRAFASTQRLSCHRLAANSSLNTIYISCSLVWFGGKPQSDFHKDPQKKASQPVSQSLSECLNQGAHLWNEIHSAVRTP